MLRDETASDVFAAFVVEAEPRLRRALTAVFGPELGREAAAEALAYGWEHWERIAMMENPAGYLYRVGRDRGRRMKPLKSVAGSAAVSGDVWFEPGLEAAMRSLSERQRVVVSLLYAFDWSMSEVAELLGVSKSAVQSYERRALRILQKRLGVSA